MDLVSPKQLCQNFFIIPCFGPGEKGCVYEIYVVPLEYLGCTDLPPLRPKVMVCCSEFGRKLCVLGTVVYLFDSASCRDSAIGSFGISEYLSSEKVVELDGGMICPMAPMRHPKRFVKAVPTPGGKILAFSTKIVVLGRHGYRKSSEEVVVDFELYHPDTDCWEDIPPIYQDWDMRRRKRSCPSFKISSCSFVDDSTFLIQTSSGYIFRFTLGGRWEDLYWMGGHHFPFSGFSSAIAGGGKLCLTPDVFWDIENFSKVPKEVCHFPRSAFKHDHALSPRSQTLIFEKTSSCCYILETAQHDQSGAHYLKIYAFKLGLVEYFIKKKHMEAWYLRAMKKLDEQNRAWEQRFMDTHGGDCCCVARYVQTITYETNRAVEQRIMDTQGDYEDILALEQRFRDTGGDYDSCESMHEQVMKIVEEDDRAVEQHIMDTHIKDGRCDEREKEVKDLQKLLLNKKKSLLSKLTFAPQLGYLPLTVTTLCLSHGSLSSLFKLGDSVTFLSGAAADRHTNPAAHDIF